MCGHKKGEACQKCQEKVAVESLLSISQASNDAPSGVSTATPMTPPPSVRSTSPAHSEVESIASTSDDSSSSSDLTAHHLKRKSKLAEVTCSIWRFFFFLLCALAFRNLYFCFK